MYHKLHNACTKCYRCHFDLVSNFNVGLKSLLRQGLSEPEFYGDLVYNIGYNINVILQTACMVINPING